MNHGQDQPNTETTAPVVTIQTPMELDTPAKAVPLNPSHLARTVPVVLPPLGQKDY
jgi:hypothetical protein